jgi:hypothetical protein
MPKITFFSSSIKNSLYRFDYKESFIKIESSKRLVKKIEVVKISPKKIYIEGVFSRKSILEIKRLYPKADIKDSLSYQLDLIISNLKMHTVENIYNRLILFQKLLSRRGILLFSTIGHSTLLELKNLWKFIDSYNHINEAINIQKIGNMLLRCRFYDVVNDIDILKLSYTSIKKKFLDIKQINEPLLNFDTKKTLNGKYKLLYLFDLIRKYNRTITYEIIYTHSIKL